MGFLTLVRTGPTGASASQGPDLLLGPTSGQVKSVIFFTQAIQWKSTVFECNSQ